MPLRATQRAAIAKGPRMSYSPVPTPEGTKETYWETKAPSSDVKFISSSVSIVFKQACMRHVKHQGVDYMRTCEGSCGHGFSQDTFSRIFGVWWRGLWRSDSRQQLNRAWLPST
jgi:hypothetical protein